jgi:hypothetical protein
MTNNKWLDILAIGLCSVIATDVWGAWIGLLNLAAMTLMFYLTDDYYNDNNRL